ncbi:MULTISPECIES: S8 family serine peptidase [unclassified Streptomyces]|uniref:S8 family serine peptidase n=1 Tax=unclassified Streptomyces TaxID=2593676 RepID=UPI002ED10ADC|nr:S8 family serine peptidase [Streptomyces sp. NBC_00891]WSY08765.1 S8 family serine peptidase [Streptomyces sp. NBC_00890]WSZ10388.1 S8 family serine peptidase [Streptomyces sp. NBC_00869]WSZ22109.1 S8 family serine peptidase [Streptomyces sp. NBC_00870]
MHLSRSPRRRTAAWAAAALTATGLLIGPPTAAAADGPTAQVDSALMKAVDKGGESTFFVVLKDKADLTTAKRKHGHAARAKSAFDELKAKAHNSQQSLNTFLDKKKVGHQDFWIANAVKVTGDQDLVEQLAKRSDVERIVKEQHYKLDDIESKPTAAQTKAAVKAATRAQAAEEGTPEWGVKDIKADRVWEDYQDRGEGIVIANVDSGVQYDHPDLVDNYRGNNGDGSFTHDYNWYDASGECPTDAPCDNNGHGTHTMGTMVGRNGVGVAPNAKWIAAKGCESDLCTDSSLLAAGQWILAPTDANGQNPRPDLAPNIVNNSWGNEDAGTPFYEDMLAAWNAAGIFEAFAAGNDGDGVTCSTTHPPGSQASSYGVGAYDSTGKIASFSGFGPSLVDGSAKPNISAPGVDVRSTWPGNAYNTISGTSMATPHLAGSVALLWSAAPSLIGDVDATRALLNDGATDVEDTHCGGTADMNNVWGEGKLDILSSIDKAPHTAATMTGKVTNKANGAALSGITVEATGATGTREVSTHADGTYRFTLAPGTYSFKLSGYGFAPATVSDVTVTAGQDLGKDFSLDAVPAHKVTGKVLDVQGRPLAKATVQLSGSPVPAVTTATDGTYTLPTVSEGSYTLTVTPAAPVLCNGVSRGALTVDGDKAADVKLPNRTDAYGNTCSPATYSWIKGSTKVALTGDEDAKTVSLPFPVKLYGVSYTSASVSTNGLINFLEPRIGDYANTALPSAARPNGTVAALWDDLLLDKKSSVQTAVTGSKGNRSFAIVWNKAAYADGSGDRATFEAVFDEATGSVTLQYQSVADRGAGATVGIENQTGDDALQYSFDQPVLSAGSAVHIAQEDK